MTISPLAGLETRKGSRWTAKFGALVYRHGGHFYNFDGLRNFKDKFDPDW
ncbi:MAG: phosphatidylglycerol lysyltransferase domain-containing protein [Maritimibacter sp.]